MARPAHITLNAHALLHNVSVVKKYAQGKKIIAMVKADAYGCGMSFVQPLLEDKVDIFGVASLTEALKLRQLGSRKPCLLAGGVFEPDELPIAAAHDCQLVIHHEQQLAWLLAYPQLGLVKVWVKVNTGMCRLGFLPIDVARVMEKLSTCPWVDKPIGLMTHLACADEPEDESNAQQLQLFQALDFPGLPRSIANSAGILANPATHADVVRPGIMLYGVSPFAQKCAMDVGLRPVMCLMSTVIAVQHYPAHVRIGYGGTWESDKPSRIAVVACGYGDGYPRHIAADTPVWIKGMLVPIVGRISMDLLTIDLTQFPAVQLGDAVELWGEHVPIEMVARQARTIGYELLCQMTSRVRFSAS